MNKDSFNKNHDCYSEFAKDHFKKSLESEVTKKKKKYTLENMYHIGQEFFEDQNSDIKNKNHR